MIKPDALLKALENISINFYTGVPDSLLKDFCAYLQDNVQDNHVIAANEGGAMALGAGHYLGTSSPSLIYMQNSGLGNAVNPLLSLNDPKVYGIPSLLMIGWRGEPGVKDEPQHVKQGEVTLGLLKEMGIPYSILSSETENDELKKVLGEAKKELDKNNCYALVVKKGTFESYKLQKIEKDVSDFEREDAISKVTELLDESDYIISTTGKISRELYETRDKKNLSHGRDFLTVGSMGHASQIAAGLALSQPEKRVFCFDGDGAVLMQMGNLPIGASLKLKNCYHIVFNNGAHDSVGGQPTIGAQISLTGIARESGYKTVYKAESPAELESSLKDMLNQEGPGFLEVLVRKGSRDDLGRPKLTPVEQKRELMKNIKA